MEMGVKEAGDVLRNQTLIFERDQWRVPEYCRQRSPPQPQHFVSPEANHNLLIKDALILLP